LPLKLKSQVQGPPWSDDDHATLVALLPCEEISLAEIGARIGRSLDAVKSYMTRNNLRRARPPVFRDCLNCGRRFTIKFKFNYLCERCKRDPAWAAYPDREDR